MGFVAAGAAIGAVGAAVTGGNVLQGAALGAVGGGIGGAFAGPAAGAVGGEVGGGVGFVGGSASAGLAGNAGLLGAGLDLAGGVAASGVGGAGLGLGLSAEAIGAGLGTSAASAGFNWSSLLPTSDLGKYAVMEGGKAVLSTVLGKKGVPNVPGVTPLPEIKQVPGMPLPDDQAVARARKRSIAAQQSRMGRVSTILSNPSQKLGN